MRGNHGNMCIMRHIGGPESAFVDELRASKAHLKGWNFFPKYCSTTERNLGTPHSCTRYFMRACECTFKRAIK